MIKVELSKITHNESGEYYFRFWDDKADYGYSFPLELDKPMGLGIVPLRDLLTMIGGAIKELE